MAGKIMFASDLHGDSYYTARMLDAFDKEGADKLILLGDLLYHGPRNDLPRVYMPKIVIDLLNRYKDKILCVRGNCDAEVDGMVLDFSVSADYEKLSVDGIKIFATHGHIFSKETLPEGEEYDLFIQGHTHLHEISALPGGAVFLNPGSITLPKGGNKRSYATLENGVLTLLDIDGNIISKRLLN